MGVMRNGIIKNDIIIRNNMGYKAWARNKNESKK